MRGIPEAEGLARETRDNYDLPAGRCEMCGFRFTDRLHVNKQLPRPILTPTTKAIDGGHDEPATEAEILERGLIIADEIHTPDSSRYWFAESHPARFAGGERPESFDEDFTRSWVSARYM